MSSDAPFQVVFVCTANRFRSPIAAAFLRARVQDLPIEIASRGTLDVGPMPPLIQALQLAPRFDLDVSTHRAREIALGELAEVDLVIGFERAHLVATVERGAALPATTFTLGELVGLLDRVEQRSDMGTTGSAALLRALVADADGLRGPMRPENVPEIDDPIGKPAREFERTAQAIHDLVDKLALHVARVAGRAPAA